MKGQMTNYRQRMATILMSCHDQKTEPLRAMKDIAKIFVVYPGTPEDKKEFEELVEEIRFILATEGVIEADDATLVRAAFTTFFCVFADLFDELLNS